MTGDVLASSVDELYGLDPSEFTARRKQLASQARQAGAVDLARQIEALRRPTQSAWVLNRLVRVDPELAKEFVELGGQLRAAHLSLQGDQIRELTKQRHQLIDQTARQAFSAAGQAAPAVGLRDEVTATLGAVLSDPEVAARFATGSLVKAENHSGFGPIGPRLTSVPAKDAQDAKRSAGAVGKAVTAAGKAATGAGNAATSVASAPSKAARHSHELRLRKIAAAELAVRDAEQATQRAEQAKQDTHETVRRLTDQLADAKRREDDALLEARHAVIRLRQARQELSRLPSTELAES